MDVYLLEAMINGLLLGGVLALLALGLNLIFGVIDVVWIAYADLVMCGMYAVYWLFAVFGWPLPLAFAASVVGVAVLGVLVHLLIIAPILGSAPINQLLATGGLLYFLQSFATLIFTTDFRNIGVRLPIIEIGGIYISYSRLLAFAVALVGATALYLFLKRTYIGTAIRAIAQDREIIGLMGVDQRRIYLVTSAIGGALAGLGACLLALQYDVHPFIGNTFGPLIFMICVLGGLGNMIGAFMGVGAYVPALLWNYFDVTPWLGIPLGIVLSALLGVIIGYPCFRLKVVGHYFALVTLALGQVVLLSIVAARDITGGSLGMTPRSIGHSWYALQFPDKAYFYMIALLVWVGGLLVWRWIDRGIGREALEAISDDEEAAAAVGIDVTREKLRVTVISAALTALGGALFGQYLMYLNPETVSGIGVSLQIVFAAIAGGMYAMLGPTVGALLTIALTEGLRVWFGANFVGAANAIYGILLILFVVFMPRGILGWLEMARRPRAATAPAE